MRLFLTLVFVGLCVLPAYAGKIETDVARLNLSRAQLLKIGETLFNTKGTNTCVYCHGKGGHGGNQAGAADLRHPRTWRSYQALGGDDALKANREIFLRNLETSLHYLIRHGATRWNLKFSKRHKDIQYDWSRVTVPDRADKYNNMMKGVTSGPMKKGVKKLQKELKLKKSSQARNVAAVAAFEYVKTLDDGSDKGGVFK